MKVALRAGDWTHTDGVAVRGRAFDGDEVLAGPGLAKRFRDALADSSPGADERASRLEATAAVAMGLEGFYAVVAVHEGETFLVADEARSIPLYYDAAETIVSDRGQLVRERLEAETDPIAESEFLLTRYVTGPETIWRGVYSTRAGEVVRIGDDGVDRRTYREYWPIGECDSPDSRGGHETHPAGQNDVTNGHSAGAVTGGDGHEPATDFVLTSVRQSHLQRLESGFETALDRLERVAGARPIVVPLSGGYDSRLLAAALAARDREVIGYTFGRSGHPDVEVSREVADRLGIDWVFLPYGESNWWQWYHGEDCSRYRERAFGGDMLPFLAEWPALRALVDGSRLPEDALYCPGHTVATPSERLPTFVENRNDEAPSVGCGTDGIDETTIEPTVDELVAYVLETHYSLWQWDDDRFYDAACDRIRRGLLGAREPDAVADPATAAAAYERWEWRGRMSTFTNGDLRAYEDAGVDWWLPLWDPAYVRAWERIPRSLRRGKELHAELARRYYARAAAVPKDRTGLVDRTLSPFDRHLNLVRHTPARQFTERRGDWEPPFLAPRSVWANPGTHPLAWYGVLADDLRDSVPSSLEFYALRTLATTGCLEFSTTDSSSLESARLTLPTEREG
ncbi:asparagine synthase-related protein [Natronobacterium gregoryi]|uniref:Asparagine synthase n=2 Tax=Natronobacterium gregoryi TaxID=44930 RepID=L0AJB9_NATGS|nr:asparagine synthase-related protein [Natronobacterium gregoryi]AFZ73544.1 asparagine synthase (glutamine-hydrolyzing) [Natronobacterium gregoryi SP2]ELY68211.1 asparagine synthase [Natronobacterium gregoryi SP2]PLK20554.1 asparagine synthase [Natronobacterium gregoryi SP2]SFJ17271.1 asparagine synthase (glutamine-hydrolysing) [Natronobacterium gregoryi]